MAAACSDDCPSIKAVTLTCFEFFSGIGGNRIAVERCAALLGEQLGIELRVKIVGAVEVNDRAVAVYRENLPKEVAGAKTTHLLQKHVEDIDPSLLEGPFGADVWLLSPPCQPFSRQGQQLDLEDTRCTGLERIIDLIRSLRNLPRVVFVENVRNFEVSAARAALVSSLGKAGFASIREYLINPADEFQWPNSRLRYYLVAVRPPVPPESGVGDLSEAPSLPPFVPAALSPNNGVCRILRQIATTRPLCVGDFVDPVQNDNSALLVPMELLSRMGRLADFVVATSTRSCCFTKAYGRKVEGTGSLYAAGAQSREEVSRAITSQDTASLAAMKIRFFAPAEVASLMGFVPCAQLVGSALFRDSGQSASPFHFPESASQLREQWQLLGNSVCVHAVAAVLFDGLLDVCRDRLPKPE